MLAKDNLSGGHLEQQEMWVKKKVGQVDEK